MRIINSIFENPNAYIQIIIVTQQYLVTKKKFVPVNDEVYRLFRFLMETSKTKFSQCVFLLCLWFEKLSKIYKNHHGNRINFNCFLLLHFGSLVRRIRRFNFVHVRSWQGIQTIDRFVQQSKLSNRNANFSWYFPSRFQIILFIAVDIQMVRKYKLRLFHVKSVWKNFQKNQNLFCFHNV